MSTENQEEAEKEQDPQEAIESTDSAGAKKQEVETIDLKSLDRTRQLWEFPFSAGLHQSLRERGFSVATRLQASIIERALAGRSFLLQKPGRNSQLMAYCISLAELSAEADGLVVVLAHSRHAMDFIVKEYSSLARYSAHNLLVATREKVEQELLDKADIVIASRDSTEWLAEALGDRQITRLCLCDAARAQPGPIIGKLAPSAQIFGATSALGEALQPLLDRGLDLLDAKESGQKSMEIVAITAEDKTEALYRLSMGDHPEPFAVVCESEEERSSLLQSLASAGVSAELWAPPGHSRRRESILQGVQMGRTQVVLLLDTDWEFRNISKLVGMRLPKDTKDLAGKYSSLQIIQTTEEWASASEWLDEQGLKPSEPPERETARAQRLDRMVASLRRDRALLGTGGHQSLVDLLAKLPDGQELLATALHGYEQGAIQRRRKREDGVRRLESKDNAPRKGRHQRRR
jgi:hypothetical protein